MGEGVGLTLERLESLGVFQLMDMLPGLRKQVEKFRHEDPDKLYGYLEQTYPDQWNLNRGKIKLGPHGEPNPSPKRIANQMLRNMVIACEAEKVALKKDLENSEKTGIIGDIHGDPPLAWPEED